ncbi:hypothetical protein E3P81_00237 [Wallemia ichthyophaga]|nr:hypothetical protein E3P91_01595 [Wallemia ichthyophaga]TIA82166.1 hypothetical protein E3P98_01603 [Wallemia ichthyophaga]TIA94240.1 hypothetical protein E3P97_00239 [Wallemia ichthyophaga]TIB50941.1 hypothetical protein E3P82_00239 [Wallemia ichthyophaga]TIB54420.1 hypothetical protein E3P81_00237 [Wallemia ichthyophaga]
MDSNRIQPNSLNGSLFDKLGSANIVKNRKGASMSLPSPSRSLLIRSSTLPARYSRIRHSYCKQVLSRSTVLKSDHYLAARAKALDISIQGAPNFRRPKGAESIGVYGTAQPTIAGLRTLLTLLGAAPTPSPMVSPDATLNIPNTAFKSAAHSSKAKSVFVSTRDEPIVYISGRSYVLRHATNPKRGIQLSYRAESLEGIEERLKADVLNESRKYGGLIMTHEEDTEGEIVPTWLAVDASNVLTSRELWHSIKREGFNLDYHRIPISPETPIEDNYLDAYVNVMKDSDPRETNIIFSCGMGVVRTTYAMTAALLVRRKQLLLLGEKDPFQDLDLSQELNVSRFNLARYMSSNLSPQPSERRASSVLQQASAQHHNTMSLLRLTHLVEQTLLSEDQRSAIELLIEHPNLLEDLRSASLGDYHVVLNIMACLERGNSCKGIVDHVVDMTDHVVNLRESVLENRLRSSLTRVDEDTRQSYLLEALKALERYAFAVCFAGYLDECQDLNKTFIEWLQQRKEIGNMIQFLRHKGGKLFNFAPVADLSDLSKRTVSSTALAKNGTDPTIAGGTVLADEYAELVVHRRNGILLRSSTLLKNDIWRQTEGHVALPGAVNFRRVSDTNIYALGQPDISAIDHLVEMIQEMHPKMKRITWINLREEPLSYVNQEPYCLRKEGYSFRNLKDFGGISASRLEVLEDRLKNDVAAEVTKLDGKLLLHTETNDGKVVPIWEDVNKDDIASLRDIMTRRAEEIEFKRIPITSEAVPDFIDLHDLMNVVIQTDSQSPIVVNCQLGRGRSTLAAVLIILIQKWLKKRSPLDPHIGLKRQPTVNVAKKSATRKSYQPINNLLRVVRRGLELKNIVDDAIDEAGDTYNCREAVEDARVKAVEAKDEATKRQFIQKGLIALRRYYWLIVFQSYLQEAKPDTLENLPSLKDYVEFRPVLRTFENEIKVGGLESLQALKRDDNPPEGNALSDEVERVVRNRNGRILSAQTLLKSDFFSQLQKMSLPERVEGAANFRRVPLSLAQNVEYYKSANLDQVEITETDSIIVGVGMPSGTGLRKALEAMNTAKEGNNKVTWTCLREEPVIYIVGHPHVLRLANKPLTNVESTGVSTEVVEAMESTLKKDVIMAAKDTGRVLLHDEQEISPGNYKIIPIWQNAEESDILTPREMFEAVQLEGYKVDYSRVAITDEQAPLPNALAELQTRCVKAVENGHSMAFNCQMGRGRTTTGMIVSCLVTAIYHKPGDPIKAVEEVQGGKDEHDGTDLESEDDDSTHPHLNGEYRVILELVGVLKHGKRAKMLADKAIDLMEGVQNLRKAVYSYKLQAEAQEEGTPKFERLSTVAFTSTNLDLALTKPQERKQEKMATSEGEDVKAMKASLRTWWKGFAKRKNESLVPIFGIALRDSLRNAHVQISTTALESDEHFVCGFVPVVVAKCGLHLKETATETEGTFRISGSSKRMKELQAIFESPPKFGKNLDWKKYAFNSHDVASVLRRYLTLMPEPVIPHEFYDNFRSILKSKPEHREAISKFQNVIVQLPGANQCLLLYVLDLLAVFDRKSRHNKMNAFNLAVIFQPGILSHPSHAQQPDELKQSQETLEFLIKHQDHFLFALTSKKSEGKEGETSTAAQEQPTKVLGSPISQKGEIMITPTDSDEEDRNGGWELKKSNSGLSRSKTSYAKSKNQNKRVVVDLSGSDSNSNINDNGKSNSRLRNNSAGDSIAVNKGANISRRATTPSRRFGKTTNLIAGI